MLSFRYSKPEIGFTSVKSGHKVLLIRNARDGVERGYVGDIVRLRKSGAFVIDLLANEFFEDGRKLNSKPKEISFRNSSDIKIYLIQDLSDDSRSAIRDKRKAYAEARKHLSQVRDVSVAAFATLEITQDVSREEFNKLRKKLMLYFHPDRKALSPLSDEEFDKKSKLYTDALAFVDNFLTKRDSHQ